MCWRTTLLKPHGVAAFEFPHLLQLLTYNQFDAIYHEHFSYVSITALQSAFAQAGLQMFDVHTLPIHGGSLRVFVQRAENGREVVQPTVAAILAQERSAGMHTVDGYRDFQPRANKVKNDLLTWSENDGELRLPT